MGKLTGPYSVYVLLSERAQRHYIGVTEDVQARLEQHNAGVSRWTRGCGPWRLVWSRQFPDYRSGRRFEIRLKKRKGGAVNTISLQIHQWSVRKGAAGRPAPLTRLQFSGLSAQA
jgi:putative endonuclease